MGEINGAAQEINDQEIGQRSETVSEEPQAEPTQEVDDQEVVIEEVDGQQLAKIKGAPAPLRNPTMEELPGDKVRLKDGRVIKRKHLCSRLDPGNVMNPWLKWPRNTPCFCGSGRKFKVCCDGSLQRWVSEAEGKKMMETMPKLLEVVETLKAQGITFKDRRGQ